MSIEQWVVLALAVLLPLLEGVARLRRTRATRSLNGGGGDTVAQAPSEPRPSPLSNRYASERVTRAAEKLAIRTASPPPPLAPPTSDPAVSLARLRASQESEPQRRAPKRQHGDGAVQWLRPMRNLRRAIVVATILGPPSQ